MKKKVKISFKEGKWELTYGGAKLENVQSLEILADAENQALPVVKLGFYDAELDIEGDVDLYEFGERR